MCALRCGVLGREAVPLSCVDAAGIAGDKPPASAGALCVDGAPYLLANVPRQRDAARRRFFSPAHGGVERRDLQGQGLRNPAVGMHVALCPVEGDAKRGTAGAASGA